VSGKLVDFGAGLYADRVLLVDASGNALVTTTGVIVGGGVAHDAADTGNPIKIGGKALASVGTAVTAGDRVNARFDLLGQLYVLLADPLGADISNANGLYAQGAVAHDAADAGNPVSIGGRGVSGIPTAVTANDRVRQRFDLFGQTFTIPADASGNALMDSTGAFVQGHVAHDAADAGNPLKLGGKGVSAVPTAVTANDRVNARFDLLGQQVNMLADTVGAALLTDAAASADAVANPTVGRLGAHVLEFNGTTWDRARNNELEAVGLANAARTATATTAALSNLGCRGILVNMYVGTASGTGGLTLKIRGRNADASGYFDMLTASAAIVATGFVTYMLYPGASAVGSMNTVVPGALPRTFNIQVVHGDASSYTYNVVYYLIK
jgi:hypothetical protein